MAGLYAKMHTSLKKDLAALLNWKTMLVILVHMILTAAAYAAAFAARFEYAIPERQLQDMWRTLPLVVIVFGVTYFLFGIYKTIYRYASLNDMQRILASIISGTAILFLCVKFIYRIPDFPNSAFIIFLMSAILFIGGFNISGRVIHSLRRYVYGIKDASRLLIVGAGEAGATILSDIMRRQVSDYIPIGFVDDDPDKIGKAINGVPILGCVEELPTLANENFIDEIFIAIPSTSSVQMRRIVNACKDVRAKISTIPALEDILRYKARLKDVRKIELLDLLRRDPVYVDLPKIKKFIHNKTIMVTGAGGSIGSELCKLMLKFSPRLLILYELSEHSLYTIENDLLSEHPGLEIAAVLGSTIDREKVERTLLQYKPDIIFHAAACKHVPMSEKNPIEAISANLIGTATIESAADKYGVEKFIFISTDKAVNPINVMGASKRAAELVTQMYAKRSETVYASVRFGNVLGSSGSVVRQFERQIGRGGPVTVCQPETTRYFMSSFEAVELILQAAAFSKGGEIFILDMGQPIRILDLAKDIIMFSGFKPEKDIKIKFTDLRIGDKIAEELYSKSEKLMVTDHKKIMMIQPGPADAENIEKTLEMLRFSLPQRQERESVRLLKTIVPEYTPSKLWR